MITLYLYVNFINLNSRLFRLLQEIFKKFKAISSIFLSLFHINMGSGSSVLPPHLAQQLTPSSLNEFLMYEKECDEKNYKPAELHLYLKTKFDQLLTEDKRLLEEAEEAKKLAMINLSVHSFIYLFLIILSIFWV